MLKKNTFKWHNDLSTLMRSKMNESLIIWKNELLQKFKTNRFKSFKKMKKMIFHFDDKKQSFNQYFIRKINLLHDVEINNENIIMKYLWNELKTQLTFVTSFRENENIIKIFNRRMRNNKQIARKIWKLQKRMTRSD